MKNEEINVYLKLLLDMSNNNCLTINEFIDRFESLFKCIKVSIFTIYKENIFKYDAYNNNIIDKTYLLESNKSELDKIITKLHSNEKLIFNNISEDKYKNYKNKIIYPLKLNRKIHGFISIYSKEDLIKTENEMDLFVSLLNKNINAKLERNIKENNYMDMYDDVIRAIELKEFKFLYQPKFNLSSGKVIGSEALIRWDKDGTILSPDKFIGKIEEYKLIYLIDYYTIEECLRQISFWNKKRNQNMIPISINISKSTLMRDEFIEKLAFLIDMYDVNLSYMEFEITEREYTNYSLIDINNRIKEVRDKGIKVSIDDFGAGNSNLAFSVDMDIDTIKIDKSIVDRIGKSKNIDILLPFIVEVSNNKSIDIVAEGIETKEQLDILIDSGYKFGQGYYFSKPISCEEFERQYLVI